MNQENLQVALKRYFGFSEFKDQQAAIIQNILDGKDTLVIMPTGGGKSLCYQLPALMSEGTAIVISPLIALMKNQVDSIRSYSQEDNVAHFLNSSLNKTQTREVRQAIVDGHTKMLYVAPETLTKEENIEFFRQVNVSFVAIDEAHCISEWGHDFRPEYRRIREMITSINEDIPLIALTATATPKVKSDIVKTLKMKDVTEYVSSFNRTNLYYEVRPKINKEQTIKEIIQVIKKQDGESGIIYVQARKTTEEIAQILSINDIKAVPYHAGLDSKTRNKVQDDFLMEEADVIVATIAFGMGIDKPDVRFVIHYDIPKSIENYYQETGRAGRDGMPARCVAFYAHKDILRLEKFLKDKPLSERQLHAQLMQEVIAYTETSQCRRKFLLHYFGEEFDADNCDDLCDNCSNPKPTVEAGKELQQLIKVVKELNENYGVKFLVEYIIGRNTQEMKNYRFDSRETFGLGKDKSPLFWHSLIRQALLSNYLRKDIEQYGLLKLTESGEKFLEKGGEFQLSLNHDYSKEANQNAHAKSATQETALDKALVKMLKALRLKEAKKHDVQPWILFLDPSINDMATFYPTSIEEMTNIAGVSAGKAKRYGQPFIELIQQYVEENNIEKVENFVVKQVANKSKSKVAIIQGVDRKIPLEELASSLEINIETLVDEMSHIVMSGTKLDINYYLEDTLDEDIIEDVYDYFSEAESESLEDAYEELKEDDITMEEIKLIRLKFLSDVN